MKISQRKEGSLLCHVILYGKLSGAFLVANIPPARSICKFAVSLLFTRKMLPRALACRSTGEDTYATKFLRITSKSPRLGKAIIKLKRV
jgi:hypothetical protein